MTTFELQPTDWTVTFAYYIKDANGDFDLGPTQAITISDCYFETQAVDKFFELTGQNYDAVCVIDCYEQEWTTEREVLKMERDAIVEHLFGTTQFGQTDVAIATKYYDNE
jgi:hypothetical protein